MTKADVQGRLNRETNPIPGERPGFNPQFIDSDGYATDVTPNTPFPSGSYVQTDAGVWIPQKGSDDGAAHVQLTGRNVEREIIFERSIRNTSAFIYNKDVPDGAIGLIAVCAVFGVTGEFESGQGLRLETGLRGPAETHKVIKISTNVSTQNRPLMVLCYPGVRMGDAEIHYPETRDAKIAGLRLTSKVTFELLISGTFNSGEGFDCQLDVEWLY